MGWKGRLEERAVRPSSRFRLPGGTCVRAWGGQCGGRSEGRGEKHVAQEHGGRIRGRCFQECFQKTVREEKGNMEDTGAVDVEFSEEPTA